MGRGGGTQRVDFQFKLRLGPFTFHRNVHSSSTGARPAEEALLLLLQKLDEPFLFL